MIEVTIKDHLTGKTKILRGEQAMVLVSDGDSAEACIAGTTDREALCEMIQAAHEHAHLAVAQTAMDGDTLN